MIVVGSIDICTTDMLGRAPAAMSRTVTITGDVKVGAVLVGLVEVSYTDVISSTETGYRTFSIEGDVEVSGAVVGNIALILVDRYSG